MSNPDDGSEWLALEQFPEWEEEARSEDDFEKPRRRLWYQIRSYLVEKQDATKVFSWLSKQHFWGQWMPWRNEHDGAFLGEFYWAPALAQPKQSSILFRGRTPSCATYLVRLLSRRARILRDRIDLTVRGTNLFTFIFLGNGWLRGWGSDGMAGRGDFSMP